MIELLNKIARDQIVSSIDTRELHDYIIYELSTLYHKTIALTGEINAITNLVTINESSANSLLLKYIQDKELTSGYIAIDQWSERTDPTSLTDNEKGEAHKQYGIFSSKRIQSKLSFIDDTGKPLPYINVTRTTLNGITEEAPDAIIENNINHILDTQIPYIVRFKKENLNKAVLNIDIKSESLPIKFNALRFIPFPCGSVIMEGLWKDGFVNIKMNGNSVFQKAPQHTEGIIQTSYDKYTLPAYIHTELVETGDFRLGLSSDNYITEISSICIGIGALIGELNVYNDVSYFGYTITLPDETPTLSSINIVPDRYSGSVNNVSVYVYDNLNSFNNITDDYTVKCSSLSNSNLNIARNTDKQLFILLKLEAQNNISPAISRLEVRLS